MNTRMLAALAVAAAFGSFACASAFAQGTMGVDSNTSMSQDAMHKDSMMMKKDAMKHGAMKHEAMWHHGMMKRDAMKKDAMKMKKDDTMGHGG